MPRLILFALLAALSSTACARPQEPAVASRATTTARSRNFVIKHDAEVTVRQPAPHRGTGETTAYRYFDELGDAKVIFRKRALHAGAAIGMHVLKHDEVYYVLSGRGELQVDATRHEVQAGTAIFMYEGTTVGIRQLGSDDLVLIIAYPPAGASN